MKWHGTVTISFDVDPFEAVDKKEASLLIRNKALQIIANAKKLKMFDNCGPQIESVEPYEKIKD